MMPKRLKRSRKVSLFDLPREIRDQIYEEVLGGEEIFIQSYWIDHKRVARLFPISPDFYQNDPGHSDTQDPRHVLTHGIFRNSYSRLWALAEDSLPYILMELCNIDKRTPRGTLGDRDKLHLDLLRTCRRVHEETWMIPYLKNVFAFGGAQSLAIWSYRLTEDQRRAVRALRLDVLSPNPRQYDGHHDNGAPWNDQIHKITPLLREIRSLDLRISLNWQLKDEGWAEVLQPDVFSRPEFEWLAAFKDQPLRSVTVKIRDFGAWKDDQELVTGIVSFQTRQQLKIVKHTMRDLESTWNVGLPRMLIHDA